MASTDLGEAAATSVLPTLSPKPTTFPGCCLALSSPLVSHLQGLLPKSPNLTLSIGSGYGLLEAILLASGSVCVVGVEVEPSPNKYLPADSHHTVPGTRFLDAVAANAAAWLFVYPRRPALVNEYLASHSTETVEQIVWIGPLADWPDYEGFFSAWKVHSYSCDTVGGRPWELIAVASRQCC